jgi:hypothetical protein
MKWGAWLNGSHGTGAKPSLTCEARSHQDAVRTFRKQGVKGELVVEPWEEPGRCHTEQFHSKDGPVLSHADLLT